MHVYLFAVKRAEVGNRMQRRICMSRNSRGRGVGGVDSRLLYQCMYLQHYPPQVI